MSETEPIPAERLALLRQLRAAGIRSEAVLAALASIPREQFLPSAERGRAYEDSALPIDCGQTISQPFMVARMTELLELQPNARVLEIGTGSGYQAAILARLARVVYTIEWHLRLLTDAAERLQALGFSNVVFRCGDGSLGWPEQAPFDAIIVTAGAPDVPPKLLEQLAEGAVLVAPVGPLEDQVLVRVRNTPLGRVREEILRCRFVRLLGAGGWSLL